MSASRKKDSTPGARCYYVWLMGLGGGKRGEKKRRTSGMRLRGRSCTAPRRKKEFMAAFPISLLFEPNNNSDPSLGSGLPEWPRLNPIFLIPGEK